MTRPKEEEKETSEIWKNLRGLRKCLNEKYMLNSQHFVPSLCDQNFPFSTFINKILITNFLRKIKDIKMDC